ncbi:MAG: vitamin B12 ABC transporter ATP-binding protein BtuD [Enterobacteriaceae bacterium]
MLKLNQVAVPPRLLSFSAQVGAGQQIHLLGPNGAGKSTLLAAIAGFESVSGDIWLEGEPLAQMSRKRLARQRGYLCQLQLPSIVMPLFQYMSLHQPDNVTADKLAETIEELLQHLGLCHKLASNLNRLSGGEWQRARLAAILLQIWPAINLDSRLLLLDEPMNGLDIAQRVAVDRLLRQLCASGITVITSSHDLNHTLQHADRVWLIRQGEVIADGVPQQVMQPETLHQLYHIEFDALQLTSHRPLIVVKEE